MVPLVALTNKAGDLSKWYIIFCCSYSFECLVTNTLFTRACLLGLARISLEKYQVHKLQKSDLAWKI